MHANDRRRYGSLRAAGAAVLATALLIAAPGEASAQIASDHLGFEHLVPGGDRCVQGEDGGVTDLLDGAVVGGAAAIAIAAPRDVGPARSATASGPNGETLVE